jgi:hypothetical protein
MAQLKPWDILATTRTAIVSPTNRRIVAASKNASPVLYRLIVIVTGLLVHRKEILVKDKGFDDECAVLII